MDKNTRNFTPEQVDAQIDRLLVSRSLVSPDECVVDDLRQMFQDDERSLKSVWQRLGLESDLVASVAQQPGTLRAEQPVEKQSTSATVLVFEKDRHMSQFRKSPFIRALSLIAAACVAALIVGSMLFITNLAHQSQKSTVTARGNTRQQTHVILPPGIYIGSQSSIYRLDARSHQVLWHQQLQNIAKVVSSGNVVYVLQSNLSQGGQTIGAVGIAAVTAFDANSGKVLWTHPFKASGNMTINATDLALFQNWLYVGLSTERVVAPGTLVVIGGEVDALNVSNGKQHAVYASGGVDSLAVGTGILAISSDKGLQIYDLASTGKTPLWQIPRKTQTTVFSLSIVNVSLYAITSNNNDLAGEGQSSITAYKVRTGDVVWKSPTFPGDALQRFTVDQNVIYFGTLVFHITTAQDSSWTGNVYAYDTLTNKQLWSQPVPGGVQVAPVVSNGMLYVTADSLSNGQSVPAHVVALTTAQGTIKWQQPLANELADSLCISNGVLYTTNGSSSDRVSPPDGLYALNAESGSVLWENTQVGSPTIVVPTA